MRIAVANTQVPFIHGGSEALTAGLVAALSAAGHEVELVTVPFRFHPPAQVLRSMEIWENEDFERFDCGNIDAVVCLRFPSYYLRHPNRIVWLLHQHRAVYELWDTAFGVPATEPEISRLRDAAIARDSEHLRSARAVFTIARRVSDRLRLYNRIDSTPVYHPPPHAERFYCGEILPYIFFPSRLEQLKRQSLLIRAMARVRSPTVAIIAGEGGSRPELEALIAELDVHERVRLIGRVGSDELVSWYANALAIFFGPFDEDYGYVTLEAMLSAKPVITCSDSGGPTEFVSHDETGLVMDPSPDAIADAIDSLWADRDRARTLGANARQHYLDMDISWPKAVRALTSGVT